MVASVEQEQFRGPADVVAHIQGVAARAGDVVVAGVHDERGRLDARQIAFHRRHQPPELFQRRAGRGRKARRSSVPALHLREDAPAQLVVHDAVGEGFLKTVALAEIGRLEDERQKEAQLGDGPAVVPQGRGIEGQPPRPPRITLGVAQREHGPGGKPAHEHRVHVPRERVEGVLDAPRPVRPAGGDELLFRGAMPGKLRAQDGEAVSVQALAEDLHFGGRPGKAVHQQKADAPPREERAESFKALHRRENPCRRAGVSPGPAKVSFSSRGAGFHPAGAWQDRPLRV